MDGLCTIIFICYREGNTEWLFRVTWSLIKVITCTCYHISIVMTRLEWVQMPLKIEPNFFFLNCCSHLKHFRQISNMCRITNNKQVEHMQIILNNKIALKVDILINTVCFLCNQIIELTSNDRFMHLKICSKYIKR